MNEWMEKITGTRTQDDLDRPEERELASTIDTSCPARETVTCAACKKEWKSVMHTHDYIKNGEMTSEQGRRMCMRMRIRMKRILRWLTCFSKKKGRKRKKKKSDGHRRKRSLISRVSKVWVRDALNIKWNTFHMREVRRVQMKRKKEEARGTQKYNWSLIKCKRHQLKCIQMREQI